MNDVRFDVGFKYFILSVLDRNAYEKKIREVLLMPKINKYKKYVATCNKADLIEEKNLYGYLLEMRNYKRKSSFSYILPIVLIFLSFSISLYGTASYEYDLKNKDIKKGHVEIIEMMEALDGIKTNEDDNLIITNIDDLTKSLYFESSNYCKARSDMPISETLIFDLLKKYEGYEQTLEFEVIKEIQSKILVRKITLISTEDVVDTINQSIIMALVFIVFLLAFILLVVVPNKSYSIRFEIYLLKEKINIINNQIA